MEGSTFYNQHLSNKKVVFKYSTVRAFAETVLFPKSGNWNKTDTQVGGWVGFATYNAHDQTVTFTINNTAGTNSFFGIFRNVPLIGRYLNVPDNLFGAKDGNWARNIYQTFSWTENIDPLAIERVNLRERNEERNRRAGFEN
jgi:hypothetical protein